jgi:hypothetical protein
MSEFIGIALMMLYVAMFGLFILVIVGVEREIKAAREAQKQRWAWLDKERS